VRLWLSRSVTGPAGPDCSQTVQNADYVLRMKVWLGSQGGHRLFIIERWRVFFGSQPMGAVYRPSRLKLVSGLWPAVTFVAAIDGRIASYICPTGRDWLRGWTIGLGVRPVGASGRPDLDIRCTASDCHGPLDTRANGPPMARSLLVPAVVRS
jgi:hypothetical protein